MFRCITVLKGLVIDIDSFQDDSISEWDDLTENFEILFITENKETVKKNRETLWRSKGSLFGGI